MKHHHNGGLRMARQKHSRGVILMVLCKGCLFFCVTVKARARINNAWLSPSYSYLNGIDTSSSRSNKPSQPLVTTSSSLLETGQQTLGRAVSWSVSSATYYSGCIPCRISGSDGRTGVGPGSPLRLTTKINQRGWGKRRGEKGHQHQRLTDVTRPVHT